MFYYCFKSAETYRNSCFPEPNILLIISLTFQQTQLIYKSGDKETIRQGDKESRGRGLKETGRQGDKETRRQAGKETRRLADKETSRRGDR